MAFRGVGDLPGLAVNEKLVWMERATKAAATKTPPFLPKSFLKKDGTPNVEFEGYRYFVFPMEHREFSDTGLIGNPLRASKEKGQKANRRYGEHLGRALKELEKVKAEVRNREFINRVRFFHLFRRFSTAFSRCSG